jgi:hypothetical protein
MSKDHGKILQRYEPDTESNETMIPDNEGSWVLFDDVETAIAEITDLRAQLRPHEEPADPGLPPCPFCGDTVQILTSMPRFPGCDPTWDGGMAYAIRCRSCASEGGWAKSISGAVDKWSRRDKWSLLVDIERDRDHLRNELLALQVAKEQVEAALTRAEAERDTWNERAERRGNWMRGIGHKRCARGRDAALADDPEEEGA